MEVSPSAQPAEEKNTGCRNFAWACALATLLFLSPFIYLGCGMIKAGRDVRNAEAEIRRTVNPVELKTWAATFLEKHAKDSELESRKQVDDLPPMIPRFGKRPSIHMQAATGTGPVSGMVMICWNFLDQGLCMTIHVGGDDAPSEPLSPNEWVPGVYFRYNHK